MVELSSLEYPEPVNLEAIKILKLFSIDSKPTASVSACCSW